MLMMMVWMMWLVVLQLLLLLLLLEMLLLSILLEQWHALGMHSQLGHGGPSGWPCWACFWGGFPQQSLSLGRRQVTGGVRDERYAGALIDSLLVNHAIAAVLVWLARRSYRLSGCPVWRWSRRRTMMQSVGWSGTRLMLMLLLLLLVSQWPMAHRMLMVSQGSVVRGWWQWQ